jgi:hypothetical protein
LYEPTCNSEASFVVLLCICFDSQATVSVAPFGLAQLWVSLHGTVRLTALEARNDRASLRFWYVRLRRHLAERRS